MGEEESPEERAVPLRVLGLLVLIDGIVASFGQGKVDGSEEKAVEQERPLRNGSLEDGVE